jgi:hypothetical protein
MKRVVVALAALAASGLATGPALALNPQPLPPKALKYNVYGKYNWVLLNPQPLPPKYKLFYLYRR